MCVFVFLCVRACDCRNGHPIARDFVCVFVCTCFAVYIKCLAYIYTFVWVCVHGVYVFMCVSVCLCVYLYTV